MKEYFNSIGLDVTVTVIGLLATFLGWLVGRLMSYKQRIVKDTLDDVKVDLKQDGAIDRMDGRIDALEKVIDKLERELGRLKGENQELEGKLFRNLERVESKIDKVYDLILNNNKHG